MKNELFIQAQDEFISRFGRPAAFAAFAPGRVNLIGEHVDYNDGLVLPIAIEQRVYTLAAPRNDGIVHAHSLQVGNPVEFSMGKLEKQGGWADALIGVFDVLCRDGDELSGMNILFSGDVPLEAGLSSSAAFTVSALLCVGATAGRCFGPMEVAKTAQRVEHEFMGVACGLLDQAASAASKIGHALLFDCRSLDYRHIPYIGGHRVVVCHTGVTRALAGSAYNQRRQECAQGLEICRKNAESSLGFREMTLENIWDSRAELGNIIERRLTHVITEIRRVKIAAELLEKGDMESLGKIFLESHESLRDNYEVSCRELDAMVEIASKFPGCSGARLVGAGFGGCAIALVEEEAVKDFCRYVAMRYYDLIKRSARLIPVLPGRGARVLDFDS